MKWVSSQKHFKHNSSAVFFSYISIYFYLGHFGFSDIFQNKALFVKMSGSLKQTIWSLYLTLLLVTNINLIDCWINIPNKYSSFFIVDSWQVSSTQKQIHLSFLIALKYLFVLIGFSLLFLLSVSSVFRTNYSLTGKI